MLMMFTIATTTTTTTFMIMTTMTTTTTVVVAVMVMLVTVMMVVMMVMVNHRHRHRREKWIIESRLGGIGSESCAFKCQNQEFGCGSVPAAPVQGLGFGILGFLVMIEAP
jgi:hypothetical protein